MRNTVCTAATLALALTLAHGGTAGAAEIKVMSSTGVSTVMKDLGPAYEKSSGNKLDISYDTSAIIMERVKKGETADLIILTGPQIEALAKQGKVVAGSRADLARSGIGVAVRTGAPKPDISSVEAFKKTLLNAKSVTYTTTGASGVYFASVIEKLGIAPEVQAKAKTQAGGHVAELVATGDAELGVQMESELRGTPGADYLGPLPGELQLYTVFSAGLFEGTKQAEAAKSLVHFLTSPESGRAFAKGGMEPAGGR
ncbi:MAG: molybdenum transporter substrate-binding protein [Betaproteobacteria bacterium]|nr:molybdenum transporter substrate-binding protein [Betaproteobacteria bacterium]